MADSTKGARLKKIKKEKERTASTGRLPMILVVAMVISIQIQILEWTRTKQFCDFEKHDVPTEEHVPRSLGDLGATCIWITV
jgi:hypothetical protein